ncbi:MAG TPA: hypothetical protein VHB21_27610 [Minicystis sp.]|nr:hypothetical protein [Minicystis sp.]
MAHPYRRAPLPERAPPRPWRRPSAVAVSVFALWVLGVSRLVLSVEGEGRGPQGIEPAFAALLTVGTPLALAARSFRDLLFADPSEAADDAGDGGDTPAG